ncbi:MAG: DUF3592 domain-containing protein [Planctomycetota bacterium]
MTRKHEDFRDWTPRYLVKFGVGLAIFCGVLLAFQLYAGREAREHATWVETPCTLLRADVRRPGNRGTDFAIAVTYRYEVGGETHTVDGFGRPDDLPADWGALEMSEFFEKGIEGRPDRCWVDPDDPKESVFRYAASSSVDAWTLPLVIAICVFLAIAAFGVRRGLRVGWDRNFR